jgi:HTH-type transcriptional regulator, sugar sensing transcriptional regulator
MMYSMDRILVQCLMQLGCNEKHIKFYRANLGLGAATLAEIIKAAHLQRSTAYLIASEMVAKGLVLEDHKTYKKLYVAAEPETLLRKLEAKQRSIGRSTMAFKDALPDLQAAHHATTTRPSVRTFEDHAGLQAVWKDILETKSEILLWSNQSTEEHIFDMEAHGLFIKERTAKQIPIRVLAVDNELGRQLHESDEHYLRQTKLLPKNVPFTSETYIYDDKVAVLDFGKRVFGVITQNKQITDSQRAIFEYVWSQL